MARDILDEHLGIDINSKEIVQIQWKNPLNPKYNRKISTKLLFFISLIFFAFTTPWVENSSIGWFRLIVSEYVGGYIIILSGMLTLSFSVSLAWNILIFILGKCITLFIPSPLLFTAFNMLQTNFKVLFLLSLILGLFVNIFYLVY